MTVKIRITQLTENEFIIKPISTTAYSTNLYAELRQLKEYLQSLGLSEGIDYVEVPSEGSSPSYQLKFPGKSLVLRALYTIPQDPFNFTFQDRVRGEWTIINENYYLRMKLYCAMGIKPTECTVSDMRFVKAASDDIFSYINQKIGEAHKNFSIRSSIMTQLDQDLQTIAKHEENLFVTPKAALALGTLMYYYQLELVQKTAVAPYRIKKGDSILAPQYKAIIDAICSLVRANEQHLLTLYHEQIAAKRGVQELKQPTSQPTVAATIPEEKSPGLAEAAKLHLDFLTQMKTSFTMRRDAIQGRMDKGRCGQDLEKNIQKRDAYNLIIDAINQGKTFEEISGLIRTNRTVLTQSTSTLPSLFRTKVDSVKLLEDYGRFLSLS